MSTLFRGFFVLGLRRLYQEKKLKMPDDPNPKAKINSKRNVDDLLNDLMKKEWVVYSKRPFAGPEKLLDYLGRYANKIAISNNRILSVDDDSVTFKWRDYSDNNKIKVMTLQPEEFIRRFLNHVVPKGFMRIRFFGFLANACKKKNVGIIRKLLSYRPEKIEKTHIKKDIQTVMLELTGIDITLCQKCKKGRLQIIQTIPNKFSTTKFDTS